MTLRTPHSIASSLLLLAIACDRGASPQPAAAAVVDTPTPVPTPAPPPAPTPKPTPASATPAAAVPTPVPTPAPAVDPAIAAHVEIAADARPWSPLVVFADDDASEPALLRSEAGSVYAALGPALVELRDDGSTASLDTTGITLLRQDQALLDGDYVRFLPTSIGGDFPREGFLVVAYSLGARGVEPPPQTFRRRDDGRWHELDNGTPEFVWFPAAFGRWREGSLLALRGFAGRYLDADSEAGERRAIKRAKVIDAAIAKQKRLAVLRGQPRAPQLDFGGAVWQFASLPSGEIIAVIDGGEDRSAMVHYDDAAHTQRRLALPPVEGTKADDLRLAVRSGRDAWVAGGGGSEDHPYLAHFDGTAWTAVSTPCDGRITDIALTSDTEVIACAIATAPERLRGVILRRRGDRWAAIGTPTTGDRAVVKLLVDGDRTVVLTHDWGRKFEIWSDGPAPVQPLRFGDTAAIVRPILAAAPDRPIDDECDHLTVPLTGAPGDRSTVLSRLSQAGLTSDVEVQTVLVGEREVDAVVVTDLWPADARKKAATIAGALGAEAEAPTCNVRPLAHPPEPPAR